MKYKNSLVKVMLVIVGIYWISLIASCTAQADIVYDLEANLNNQNVLYVDQEAFYYDLFYISTVGPATISFNNYDADLGDYDDPYLYLYLPDQKTFNGLEQFTASYNLEASDDDSNYELDDGLYFYLPNFTFTNEVLAMVTSYDPEQSGTVNFNITSDTPLTIIPEPQAIGLILLTGAGLLLGRKR